MLVVNLIDPQSPLGLKLRRLTSHRRANRKFYESHREAIRARERANQPKNSKYIWEWSLKNEYHITVAIFHQMVLDQSGRCKVCSRELKTFHIDHDHKTGKVRGLLCPACSIALGLMKEDRVAIQGMIEYLEKG